MRDRLHRQTFWRLWKSDRTYRYQKEGEQRPIPRNTVFQTAEPVPLAVTGSKSKTSVPESSLIVLILCLYADVSVLFQNLFGPFSCILDKDTLGHFSPLGGLGKQLRIPIISLITPKVKKQK